jgi:glycosyltransferase involved in cell wall biosynthesis
MSNNPLVSVILIVRNGERYLAEAIESVLAQDYRPLEILVVDGQSTDKTAEIAQNFPLVRYIYQENIGSSNAYNIGINKALGEFISFISSDDKWMPTKLVKQVKYLIENPEYQYTISQTKFFLEPGYTLPPSLKPEFLEGGHAVRIMEVLLARKTLFNRIGKLNPDITFSNDVDWYSRAQDAGIKMAIIPEILLHKRVHSGSTTLVNKETVKLELWSILKQSIARKREGTIK